jgi:hypothetical protein
MDPRFFKLTSRWKRMVILMIQPLYPRNKLLFFPLWTEGNLGRPQHNSVPFAKGKNISRCRIMRHDPTTIRPVPAYIICYAKWPEGVRKPSNNDKQKAGWNYIDMPEPSVMLFVCFSETTLVATFLLLDFRNYTCCCIPPPRFQKLHLLVHSSS